MSLPLEKWAKQAVLIEARHGAGDPRSLPPKRLLSDIDDLAHFERMKWRGMNHDIFLSGDPTALEGTYGGLNAYPPAGAIPNVASISGEVAIWDPTKWTPIPKNTMLAPEAFRIAASYQLITSTAPGNGQWYPRFGTSVAGPALSAIPATQALTASITTNYYLVGDLTIRLVGAPGAANGSAIGFFHLVGIVGAAGVGAVTVNQITGHTAAAFAQDVDQGLVWTAVHTVTTINYSVQQIHWMSWN